MRYEHIVAAVMAMPWAIDPESLAWAAIQDVLAIRASGGHLTDEEINARIEAASNGPRGGERREGAVISIPVYGVIHPRAHMLARTSGGGVSAEAIGATFAAAVRDPDITGIVLDIDSPGGNVEGIHELAEQIRAARGTKPIVAVANHAAASAAYWFATAADEVVVAPSGQVGSIGIISAHEDVSEQAAREGVKTTLITSSRFKAEGNPFAPLSDEARGERQAKVDAFHRMFESDVAKGRGVPVDRVRSGFGEGRTLLAKPALDAGMVDRVDTFENTIRRVARGDVALRRPAPAAALAAAPLVEVYEAVGGLDEPEGDTGAAAPDPAALERVVPALGVTRRVHEAALRVGVNLRSS